MKFNFFSENIRYLTSMPQFDVKAFQASTGISQSKVKAWTSSDQEPAAGQLLSLSEYFGITADNLLKQNLAGRYIKPADIEFLIIDVDGVLTDGGMYYTENGDDMKKFNTKDGMGIKELTKKGFPVGIISASFSSKLVERRASALGVQYIYIGVRQKTEVLNEWSAKLGIAFKNIAFIGDDINDIEIMRKAGISACPADAVDSVKTVASVILSRKGGDGCVREFIDLYLK